MLRGVLPSPSMFDKYPQLRDLYQPFAQAYRCGDVKSYDRHLSQYRAGLVDKGTYLVIEQAREGCLRTFFKKVYVLSYLPSALLSHLAHSWLCSDKTTRLSVGAVQWALTFADTEVDTDEVECLLANLIYKVCASCTPRKTVTHAVHAQGHLRGYISHEKQTIVVAKDNAFPPLAGRAITV